MNEKELFEAPCTWFNIRRASRAVTQSFDKKLQGCGIRISQLSILYLLSQSGSAKLTDVADSMVIDRTTLSRNLRPLERARLIASSHGKDKRTRILSITELGENKIKEALPIWKEINSRYIKGIGLTEWNNTIMNLSQIVSMDCDDHQDY